MATFLTQPPKTTEATTTLIGLAGVEKMYRNGRLEYPALRWVDVSVAAGELVPTVGPSGSGSSTIINMITGIDRPAAGSVTVVRKRIDRLSEEQLALWRGENVGIVLQFIQLLPTPTALENAVLPLDFAQRSSKRLRHNLNGEQMTVTFEPDDGKGTHVPISGAVAGGKHAMAADPEHWSEALGGSPT